MPRIDPAQLLRTLSQLLSPEGGIKSAEEVPRIVKLMQKFSKKLVSKCIYIHILRASEMDLLELFLQQKGWDLLNHWFLESINSANWFLCGDLVKLFAVCPMNPARLKENVEVNQAPKLIRQLSTDQRLDAGIKSEAQQVLQQWMSVIRAPPTQQAPPAPSPRVTVTTISAGVTDILPLQEYTSRRVTCTWQKANVKQVSPEKPPVSPTDAGALHGSDDDWQPEEEKSKPSLKKVAMLKKKELDRNSATDSSVDVDDLLGPSEESSDDEEENCSIKKKKEEIERRRQEREEKKAKEEEREKKKAQERKEKSKLGYSKSELGNRGTVNNAEKERIKEVAKKLKQEAEQKEKKGKVETSSKQESPRSSEAAAPAPAIERKSSITAGLGRIPKKEKPKETAPSFSDLLGGLDVQKPKTIIKNKNKDLMDSLLNTSGGSPNKSSRKEERDGERRREEKKRSRDSLESRAREKEDRLKEKEEKGNKEKEEARSREKEERHKQKEERRSSLTGKEEKSSKEKEKSREKSSKSEERNGAKEGTLKVRPNLVIPTEKEKRSKEKETSPVTTPEAKKSPKVIKESNMFMDVLSDIMKDTPKKKKRRLSEVKAEREAKEEAAKKLKRDQDDEDAKDEANKASTSSGSDEEKSEETSAMDEEDLPFAEPLRELPREVRGILVLVKGKKTKKSIQWRPESNLVEVNYFEMDDNERANVFKLKSFEEMRKQELAREKQAGTGMKGSQMEEEEAREENKEEKIWSLRPIDFQDPEQETHVVKIWECYGKDSQEKEVQLEREGRVLKSLFFNSLPTDPAEPDLADRGGDPRAVVKDIPGEDQSCEGEDSADSVVDHSMKGWPAPMDKEPAFDAIIRGAGQKTGPQGNVPAAPPPNGLPLNISAMLQDPTLQSILGGQNVNAPPPTLKPEEAELYQSQLAAANALARNGDLPPPLHLPPPNFNQGYDGGRGGGYQNHNNHLDRPPPGFENQSHNRGHHNNFNKNRSQSERWGREDRGGFKANNFRKDARRDDRRGGGFKRPCKFWMEKGRCKAEDSCLYPHPR